MSIDKHTKPGTILKGFNPSNGSWTYVGFVELLASRGFFMNEEKNFVGIVLWPRDDGQVENHVILWRHLFNTIPLNEARDILRQVEKARYDENSINRQKDYLRSRL